MRFDGGRPCLDLVATWSARTPYERLVTPEDLRTWLVGAGVLPAPAARRLDVAQCLGPFRALRATLTVLVEAAMSGAAADPADVAALNAAARAAPAPVPQAVRRDDGTLVLAAGAAPTRESLLAAVARDGVALLTDAPACGLLRSCEAADCATVYLDTSRGRRRRWCSSEVCGNRERVARHRRR
ncbi:ABATE domain-containing protein [Streptomyces sp. V4-01]|uniref:ABATE domain-containing protein n=1 Tax=Actinacidiphila polyblastidii TaxID=3110430 RepID=A0ABU7P8U5_9ACTN|nr:ABATE domain-containing protein [Streptomyces sp. V4-01]